MDYEKKYKEAFERAKSFAKRWGGIQATDSELVLKEVKAIFPELAEIEDDRIRKELIEFVKSRLAGFPDCKRFTDWLEKQGKQKPYGQRQECVDCQFNYASECKGSCTMKQGEQKRADKVKPKFKVGDIVVVKPMACHGKIIKGKPFEIVDITEDDYISDNGKFYSISLQDGWDLIEQNPIWSEEDEAGLSNTLWAIQQARTIAKDENDMGNLWYAEDWVKSLKDRVLPQPKQEWSEEDVKQLRSVLSSAKHVLTKANKEWLKSLLLRSIGSRVKSR